MAGALQYTPPSFKDRRTTLMVFGVIEIVLGVAGGGMALLIILAQVLLRNAPAGSPHTSPFVMAMGLFFHGSIAVALVWLGVGSIKARRWARALILALSGLALALGIVASAAMLIFLPRMRGFVPRGAPQVPSSFVTGMAISVATVMFFVYILLPAVFLLAYRGKDVKATCEWRDPKVRWTDKCPLPVLALSILCAFCALGTVICALSGPILALPNGMLLIGFPAGVALIAFGVTYAYLAWGTYRLSQRAWWILLVLTTLCCLHGGFVFGTDRIDRIAYYGPSGFPPERTDFLQATGILQVMSSDSTRVLAVLSGCFYLGYVLYVKRFFATPRPR